MDLMLIVKLLNSHFLVALFWTTERHEGFLSYEGFWYLVKHFKNPEINCQPSVIKSLYSCVSSDISAEAKNKKHVTDVDKLYLFPGCVIFQNFINNED